MATDLAKLSIEVQVDGVPKAATDLRAVDAGISSGKKATDELTSSMGGLSRAAALALSVFMSFSALNIAKDAVMAAARYETLGLSMVQAGRNAGYAEEQMRAFERQLVSGGIAMAEARQTLSRLSAANLDLARSAEMARAAQDLAVVGGINSSEAFERLVQGVVTGNSVSLRTIGLMVDFEGAYARAAAAVNKTAAELTETEKVQARMNAAMESASKYAGIYELSMTTAGKQLGSFARYLDDLKVLAGQVGLDALAYSVFGLNDGLSGLNAQLREMQDSGRLEAISKDLGQGLRTAVGLIDDAVVAFTAYQAIVRVIIPLQQQLAYQATLFGYASREVGKLNLAMSSFRGIATSIAGGAGKGLMSIVNALGGPWVVGLTAAATAIYAIATADNDAEKAAKAYGSTLSEMEQKYKKLAEGADEAADKTDRLTESHREAIKRERELQLEAAKANQAQRLAVLQGMADSRNFTASSEYDVGRYMGVDSTLVNEFREVTRLLQEQKISAEEAAKRYNVLHLEAEDAAKGMTGWFNSARGATQNFAADMLKARNEAVALGESSSFIDRLASSLFGAGGAAKDLLGDLQASSTAFKSYTQGLLSVRMEEDEQKYNNLKSIREKALASGDLSSDQALAVQKELLTLEEARAANLKKFKDEQERSNSRGASAVKAAETALSSLTSKVELLKAQLAENKGQGLLVQLEKELAGYERNLGKASEATRAKAKELAAEAREIGKQIVAEQNLDVQSEFWTQYQQMTGMGLDQATQAHDRALQKQIELYRAAGVEIADIERWAQAKRLESATDFMSGMKRGWANYSRDAANAAQSAETFVTNSFQGMEDAMVNFARTGKLEFSSLVDSMLSDLTRLFYRMALFGDGSSGGGLMGGLVGGLISAIGGSFSPTMSSSALGGSSYNSNLASVGSWYTPSAKGNVFDHAPALSAYSGSIVDRPTLFPFAKGGRFGLMGEAGPEAILPLRRGPGGVLGVEASTSQAAVVQPIIEFNFEDHTKGGVDLQTTPAVNSGGDPSRWVINIVAQDMARGGKTNQATRNAFGLKNIPR